MSESTKPAQCRAKDWTLARDCGLLGATPGTNTWDAALGRFADAIRAALAQQPQGEAVAIGYINPDDLAKPITAVALHRARNSMCGISLPVYATQPQAAPSAISKAWYDAGWNESKADSASAKAGSFGLTPEKVAALRGAGLKPEEIGGIPDKQHERVHELLHWFARLVDGNANPKWLASHAFELAYYIASTGMNQGIDLRAVQRAAFLEGVNISPSERTMLDRIGHFAAAPASPKQED
ncbi:hypothetical protein [Cupriavidus sp. CuC1]|uniref:hypothetical protein n=1 Tax=Cupriavidus sp. CuC1 TaxID=3373131 RepID=UPI0037D21E89